MIIPLSPKYDTLSALAQFVKRALTAVAAGWNVQHKPDGTHGVITVTSLNGLTIQGTDGSTLAFGSGGTVAYTANNLSAFAATTSAELKGVISDETGSGALVFATSPTLVTPTLGVAAATSININSGGAVGALLSSTYTPSLTNTTNISTSVVSVCHYVRIGDMVLVGGLVDIDPTAAGAIVLGMSLPIASNFVNVADAGGVAASPFSAAAQALGISADQTNDRVSFQGTVTDTADTRWNFTFTYRVR